MPGINLNYALRTGLLALFFCMAGVSADPTKTASAPSPAEYVTAETYFWNTPRQAQRVLLEADSKPNKSKIWHVVDDAEWRTSVLFGRPDLYKGSKGVIIMVPGMGGNVKKYGIAFSTKLFANVALKQNFYPVAVQNRVYQGALNEALTFDDRWEMVKELADLNVEMREFYEIINRVTADPIQRNKERYLYGRSNGTAKILEMLHRMTLGDDDAIRAGSQVDAVLVAGLNSHAKPGFPIWTGSEDLENHEDPTDVDEIAKKIDRLQYAQMSFDKEGLFVTDKKVKFPKLIAIISKQDHYVPVELQLEMLRNFAKRHPQIEVEILLTPTHHDPTKSFVIPGGLVHNGQFLNSIIQNHFHTRPVEGRVNEITFPHYHAVSVCSHFVAYPQIPSPLSEFVQQAAIDLGL